MAYQLTEIALKFLKFAAVGCTGLIIDFAVTYGLKEKLHVNKYIANSAGFVLAASSNFFLNRIWTFGSSDPMVSLQYAKFIAVSIVGLFLNNLILSILHERLKFNFYLAKLTAIGAVLVWNFSANFFFTFN